MLREQREADLAIAFFHIIAELSAVAGGVQPVFEHVVGVRAVVASHACLVLHTAAPRLSGPCILMKLHIYISTGILACSPVIACNEAQSAYMAALCL